MKRIYKLWISGVLILLLPLTLLVISHKIPSFSQWYATNIYQKIFPPIIVLISHIPFSIYEIIIILLIILVLFFLIKDIFLLFSKQGRKRLLREAKKIPLGILYIISVILFIFIFTAGLNYARESYTHQLKIVAQPSSIDALINLYHLLIEQAADIVQYVETDSSGFFVLNRENIVEEARKSMINLNKIYGGLGQNIPRAKPLFIFGELFNNLNISGFFSPFTLEAHYNNSVPSSRIPFVITHELSHAIGFMREDEANFIAFLACKYSDNIDFQYSGHFEAISYTLSALRREINREQYAELYYMMPYQVIRDLSVLYSHSQKYDGKATAVVSQKVNDTYLKINRQEDGIKSYGRMVDLLLAYYDHL